MEQKLGIELSWQYRYLNRSMRLTEQEIYKTISLLVRRYNRAEKLQSRYTNVELECLSKMAIMELGGWIECKIDAILADYIKRKITDEEERERVNKNIIKHVYGFNYKNDIRPLCERVLGCAQVWMFHKRLENTGRLLELTSELGNIECMRNIAAHTNWDGITRTFDAPSTTLLRLKRIYPIISWIEREIKAL